VIATIEPGCAVNVTGLKSPRFPNRLVTLFASIVIGAIVDRGGYLPSN
jgi:hypothetical protein